MTGLDRYGIAIAVIAGGGFFGKRQTLQYLAIQSYNEMRADLRRRGIKIVAVSFCRRAGIADIMDHDPPHGCELFPSPRRGMVGDIRRCDPIRHLCFVCVLQLLVFHNGKNASDAQSQCENGAKEYSSASSLYPFLPQIRLPTGKCDLGWESAGRRYRSVRRNMRRCHAWSRFVSKIRLEVPFCCCMINRRCIRQMP